LLVKSGIGNIIFAQSKSEIPIQLEAGKYQLKYIDGKTGLTTLLNKSIPGNQVFILSADRAGNGAYWIQKL